ncbi:non-ribosomal peptide synthetase, partial [Jatrophihabitans sp.]|uniref:non-ribosomal peptide synthetase n=1 Tax=Jatrophihabitans sp. TaxID=1932789 RepID=UPI002F1C7FFC
MTTQTESTDAARRAAFARRLRAAATQAGSGPEAIPRGGDGPVRQSRAQHELWIQDHYLESNALYSVHQASMLHGPLDVAALSGAVEAVAARHDALRMSFPDESQVVVAGTRAPLDCLEVAGGTESERRQAGLDMLRAAIAEPFDLRAGPLMRALLLRLEPDRHLLLLNLHHSVTDGLSLGLLYQELSELYAAAVSGRAPKLAEDPLQYSDFCRWQARRGDPAASLDYWREALRNIEPILELPADRPRPAEQSHRGAVVSTRIEGRPAARLRQLAGQHGTTLATALLSAFAVVLHRRSGQRSFGVGSMVSGRIHPELDEVVGLFATTVVLGVDLREPADFATLLRRQHQVVTGAIAHQDVSFADVVEAVRPPREVSRNPLFQVLFQHESGLDADIELPGLEVEAVELDAGQAKVDLGLFTSDRGPDGIELHLSYASDLYDPLSAQAILDQVKRVTGAACDDPGCPIESLDLMPEQQRRSVVDGWNATEMDYPDSACVHELFERQVDAHPDAVAIRHGGTQVSYRELDRRANQIANRLLELGVRTESLVGLCIEHSVGMFAALLGILKAGAGYVPLDPEHPRDRLDYILQDTDARVALASRSASASLPEGITTILVDSPELALCSTERPAAPVSSENLVYAMYTSGSTGRPKGVLISHRGLVNYLWWSIDGYGLAGEHGAPMLGSIAFDLSIPNFLLPLIGGKDVSVLTEEDRSLAGLTDLLVQDQDFSLLKITPAHLDVLRGNLALREEPGAPVRSVRTYVVGADEVKAETVRAWSALAPGSRIINEYGPTETVVGCSVYEVPREHDLRQRVPIGRPIGNTTMYVLDPQLNPVPPGVVGELFIGG